MLPLKAILFDLDGTLLDTLEDLAVAVNKALADESMLPLPIERYRMLVGSGARNLMIRAVTQSSGLEPGKLSTQLIDRLLESFRHAYADCWACKTRPYPGIMEMLEQLRCSGLQMAVISNKPDEFTRQITRQFFPEDVFQVVYGKHPDWPLKPDPALALEICRVLGVEPVETALVGDSGSDMETAVRAGMLPVGVLWGFRDADELKTGGAKHLVERPDDLSQILAGDIS